MMTFSSEQEVLEFIDIMNKKALELILDCIINHAIKQVELPDGDVASVQLSCEGFENCFGGKK